MKFQILFLAFLLGLGGCAKYSVYPQNEKAYSNCKITAKPYDMKKRDLNFLPENIKIDENSENLVNLTFVDSMRIGDFVNGIKSKIPYASVILGDIQDSEFGVTGNLVVRGKYSLNLSSTCKVKADNPRDYKENCKAKIAKNLEEQINLACENVIIR